MPDATGLELIRQELGEAVLDTGFTHERAVLEIAPERVRDVLAALRLKGYGFLASLHGVDYYPHEPRLGVLYEMLDRERVDRISVKARVSTEDPRIDSVVELHPGADFPEREVYDMFGVVFEGHPDLRRILLPQDWEGHPLLKSYAVDTPHPPYR